MTNINEQAYAQARAYLDKLKVSRATPKAEPRAEDKLLLLAKANSVFCKPIGQTIFRRRGQPLVMTTADHLIMRSR